MADLSGNSKMTNSPRFPRWIWAVVVLAVAAGVYVTRPAAHSDLATEDQIAGVALPKLLDLGADKCVPCKMMAPILEELKTEYDGRFQVVFLDVWKNEGIGAEYGIKVIPTQIFFAADGTELFRHEGFYSREDILAKWQELGVEI